MAQEEILKLLKQKPMTSKELSNKLHLSRSACNRNLYALRKHQEIAKEEKKHNGYIIHLYHIQNEI